MKAMRQPLINNLQKMQVTSLSLNKEELRRLCDLMQERALEAAEIEIRSLERGDQTDEQYEAAMEEVREAFHVRVSVVGDDDSQLYGKIEEVFASPSFPENVKTLHIASDTTLKTVYNYYPRNSFALFLSFEKPVVLDFNISPNLSTPNGSYFEVKGYEATWVNGLFNEIKAFFEKKSSTLSVVHNHSIYDVLLYLLAVPLAFWACFKLTGPISRLIDTTHEYVGYAAYTYCFVVVLFGFRILFHWIRYTCPLVEYRSPNNKAYMHRLAVGAMTVAVFYNFISDAIGWFLT